MRLSRQVSCSPLKRCALHASAWQVAFFWDVYAQSYVMIGNCCIWLVAVGLLRPFNSACASSLTKFMCFFRNGIGLFSFVLAVKLQQDADSGVQDDDFISSCNVALLVLMSCCLLLDLWPLIEVAEGAVHYLKKHRSKRKSKRGEKKKRNDEPPTPPSGPSSRPNSRWHTQAAEWEAHALDVVPLRVDRVADDRHDAPSPSRSSVSDWTELVVGAVPNHDPGPSYLSRPLLPPFGLDSPGAIAPPKPGPDSKPNSVVSDMPAVAVAIDASSLLPTLHTVASENVTESSPQAHVHERPASFDLSDLEGDLDSTSGEGPERELAWL
jgi:hypothetical protein